MKTPTAKDIEEVLYDGADLKVTFGDGSPGIIKVHKVSRKDFPRFAAILGNEVEEVRFYLGGANCQLSDESFDAVLQEGLRLNFPGRATKNDQTPSKDAPTPEDFARMHEWMITQGHRDEDLWNYSPEKFCCLAKLATERQAKATAREDLRFIHLLRAVLFSAVSEKNEGAYKALERELLEQAGLTEKEDPRQAVGRLAQRLSRAERKRK